MMNPENDTVLVEYTITYTIKVQWCEEDELNTETLLKVQNLTDAEVIEVAQDMELLPRHADSGTLNVRRTKVHF